MGSEWFFSSWFTYRNGELPREPSWLREEDEAVQSSDDESGTGQAPRRPGGRRER